MLSSICVDANIVIVIVLVVKWDLSVNVIYCESFLMAQKMTRDSFVTDLPSRGLTWTKLNADRELVGTSMCWVKVDFWNSKTLLDGMYGCMYYQCTIWKDSIWAWTCQNWNEWAWKVHSKQKKGKKNKQNGHRNVNLYQ